MWKLDICKIWHILGPSPVLIQVGEGQKHKLREMEWEGGKQNLEGGF